MFSMLGSEGVEANLVLPWRTPTSHPMHSKIEEGWNWLVLGGAALSNGKTRVNFWGTDPWETGWVSQTPWLELGIAYAPSQKWEFGFQAPLTVLSSTFNLNYALNDSIKLGAKLGWAQSLSVTWTHFFEDRFFFSVTPSAGLNVFGFPESREVNAAELFEPVRLEKLNQSRFLLGGQLSLGRQLDPVDLAVLVNYDYAPGNGIDNSWFLDDSLLKHFLKVSLAASF
jgi:hypothetical protein